VFLVFEILIRYICSQSWQWLQGSVDQGQKFSHINNMKVQV